MRAGRDEEDMDLTVIAPPAEEALSLVAAKEFLRVGHAGEDTLISDLVGAATARLEKAASLALVRRTLRARIETWPYEAQRAGVRIRPGPVSGLIAVRVTDASGAAQDMTNRFVLKRGCVALKAWEQLPIVPQDGHIEIDFETGFGTAAEIPEDLSLALRRLVFESYRRGVGAGPGALPDDVVAILTARREVRI